MGLQGRFGAHGIRIPVRSPTLTSERDLVADRWKHRLAVDYTPSPTKPKLTPIRLVVRLSDPDNVSAHEDLVRTLSAAEKERVGSEAEVIKRFVGFRPHLLLTIKALLTLPPGPATRSPSSGGSRSACRNVVTSPSHLSGSASGVSTTTSSTTPHATCSSSSTCLPGGGSGRIIVDRAQRAGAAPAVVGRDGGALRAARPAVRAGQAPRDGDVEVPGELLSGTRARLFDARGYRYRDDGPLKVRSLITTNCEVGLGYAFGRRVVSPYQSFDFGEIVPDELRIADIQAALGDQRFIVDVAEKVASGERKNEMVRQCSWRTERTGPT